MISARNNLDFESEINNLHIGDELQYGSRVYVRVPGGYIVDSELYKTSVFISFKENKEE